MRVFCVFSVTYLAPAGAAAQELVLSESSLCLSSALHLLGAYISLRKVCGPECLWYTACVWYAEEKK